MKKKKVALGLSGGVDSAVAAHLLVKQGYDVTAVFLECWKTPGCRAETDHQDALKIAQNLNLPFKVLDFKKEYQTKVIDKFFADYKKGLTPNPDVWCNQIVKFGLFYDWAIQHKFDLVATGHYAAIIQDSSRHNLATSKDLHKDQTYFLHQLEENQLSKILFPLSQLTKQEVRQLANQHQLHVAQKKDSVGLCFVGDVDVKAMLKEKLGENPGKVVDVEGHVIGQHKGLWFYTIGQRHGFTINPTTLIKQSDGSTISKHNIPPFYVIGKKIKQNQLVVGFGQKTEQSIFKISNPHWINPYSKNQIQNPHLLVRIRHTGTLLPCQLKCQSKTTWQVELKKTAKGVAAGQYAVFYLPTVQTRFTNQNKQYICLGGGMISFD